MSRSPRWVGPALAVVLGAVYLAAPVHQLADSRYALVLSRGLLVRGSFDLTPDVESPRPYHVHAIGPRIYYAYPIGTSLLSLPFVAMAEGLGLPVIREDGRYDPVAEERLQAILASLLMAGWGWLVFVTARRWLPVWSAVALALAAGLGTQAMSTTSRALWSDTWALVLLQGALLVVLRGRPHPLALGSLLAWLYFTRPTYSVAIVAVMALLWWSAGWRASLLTALVGGAWHLGFMAWSMSLYGWPQPPYYWAGRLTFEHLGPAVVGHLLSPSRGLLLFLPAVVVVLAGVALGWHRLPSRPAVVASLGALALYFVVTVGSRDAWWGGFSYGPRLLTGMLPWFVVLAVLVTASAGPWLRRGLVVAALLGIAIHAPAAFRSPGWLWNAYPQNIDDRPERAWSWRDAQIFAAYGPERRPE